MKKYKKILLSIVIIAVICWCAAFTTDFIRSSSLKTPVFAFARVTADDGGSGSYYGLGYKVEVKKRVDINYGIMVVSVKMSVFGQIISASSQ